jgi:general secretion pathway protein M
VFETLQQQWQASSVAKAYAALTERDRLAVLGLAAFLGLVVLYLGIWTPAHDWNLAADQRYQRQFGVLQWMRANEQDARAAARSSAAAQRGGNNSMLTRVSSSADRAGVKLTRFQPEGGGGVAIVIQNQPFNAVLRWLDDLARERIQVRQLSLDRQGQSGLVNGRIKLI